MLIPPPVFPIAPILGGGMISGAAAAATNRAIDALGGSKASSNDAMDPNNASFVEKMIGRLWNPEAAKTAVIQASVITVLVLLFLIGLLMFVARSIKTV